MSNSIRKLARYKVVTMIGGRDKVGVFFEDTGGRSILFSLSPSKADELIERWNSEPDTFICTDPSHTLVCSPQICATCQTECDPKYWSYAPDYEF
jgi:hypothetical protein